MRFLAGAMAIWVAILCCAGCGKDGADAGVDSAVEHEVARGLLAHRENVETPPTEDEIASLVRRDVSASCRSRGGENYACRINLRGFGTYSCTARVVGQRVRDMRCGSGAAAPIVSSGFVECGRIGPAATALDPAGDTYATTSGKTVRADARAADIRALTVARGDRRLCAAFTFAAPPKNTVITLMARPQSGGRSETLAMTIDLGAPGGVAVSQMSRGAITAQVGKEGNRVSVVIAQDALPPTLDYLFTESFGFRAHATGGAQDEAPNTGQWPRYG